MAVSTTGLKIIKSAIKIRLDRNEDSLENLVAEYTKLSEEQAQEILTLYKDYVPATETESE